MTQEEKTKLQNLSDQDLLEHLLQLQQDVDRYHEERAKSKYRVERWQHFHDLLYEASKDLIDVKYMILERMAGIR